ncbi:MAG: 30S ribosomal protein S2, partial [Acidobacteria bacterium]|nr:30S ribosomal protein S2 [Acidobacteriota bacterium]
AQEAVAEEAKRCSMFYVNQRWLGGLLTNFSTIQKSVKRLKELEEMSQDGRYQLFTKKEVIQMERERQHLEQNLAGIKAMPGLPDALFVVDSNKEQIAVREARKLDIPVVAVVDSNCDPEMVNYVVPGNDDALRAIRLFTSKIADAVLEGKQLAEERATVEQPGVGTTLEVAEPELADYPAPPEASEENSTTSSPSQHSGFEPGDPEGQSYDISDIPASRRL